MQSRMNSKSRCIDGTRGITTDDVTILVNVNHVAGCHHGEVDTQRINPESFCIHRISNRDMSSSTLCKFLSSKHSESTRHVFQDPFSLLVWIFKVWNLMRITISHCHVGSTSLFHGVASRRSWQNLFGNISSGCSWLCCGLRHSVCYWR